MTGLPSHRISMKQTTALDYLNRHLEEDLRNSIAEQGGDFRRQSLQYFFGLGLPNKKNEKWKYTPVEPWFAQPFDVSNKGTVQTDFSGRTEQVEIIPYGEASKKTELLKVLVLQNTRYADPFLALNGALADDGLIIKIKKNQIIEKPIRIIFKGDAGTKREMFNWRLHIHLEAGARAQIVEEYLGQGEYFTNAVTTVDMDENSHLDFVRIQNEGVKAMHIGQLLVQQAKSSHLTALSMSFGSSLSRQTWEVDAQGQASESILNGLYLVRDRQHADIRTSMNHNVPMGISRQLFKGLIMDEGRGVFNGRIYIAPKASKVDSKQLNHNLLLSPGAEADSKPELEIYADDVKANHGASIGQLNPDELFYLQSRGISLEEATRMLAEGYVHEVLGCLSPGELKNLILEKVDQAFVEYKAKVAEVMS